MERKPTWLFSDMTLYGNRELDPFFKEFFAFIFRGELSTTRRPLICVKFDHLMFSRTPTDKEWIMLAYSCQYHNHLYQIVHGRDRCEIRLTPMTSDEKTALFASGFAAYALKNGIRIQRSSYSEGDECGIYLATIAWLRENRDSEDYDYILGKIHEYVIANNCLDKLLDFYDVLDDMEGKAEFMHYCGERGSFEQGELRL